MPRKLPILKISRRGSITVIYDDAPIIREVLYALLQLINVGKVTTYSSLSKCLGMSPRKIARFLRENKEPIVIPCHRVVRSDLSLGGYTINGKYSPYFKKKLLIFEGVGIDSKDRVLGRYLMDIAAELL